MLAQRQESVLPIGSNEIRIYGLAYWPLIFIFNLFLINLAIDSVLYSGSELIVG
jgi:hypothetical protein